MTKLSKKSAEKEVAKYHKQLRSLVERCDSLSQEITLLKIGIYDNPFPSCEVLAEVCYSKLPDDDVANLLNDLQEGDENGVLAEEALYKAVDNISLLMRMYRKIVYRQAKKLEKIVFA